MAIRAIRSFMVVMPIIAIYFQEAGLSIRQIFLLQVIFSVAIIVFELPTGYFADVFGRKNSLFLGVLGGSFGFLMYYLAPGFFGFAIAELLLAISASFISGADSAFLYDTLQTSNAGDQYTRHEGHITSVDRLSEAAAALVGGALATVIALRSIFLVEFLVMLIAIPIAVSLREPQLPPSVGQKKNIFQIVKFAVHENKKLLYLNLLSGVIGASGLTMVWFAQPYWREINVPLAYFGVLWAGLNILVSVGAFFAHRLEARVSFRALFLGFALAPLLFYGALSMGLGMFALAIIPLFWVLRGVFYPVARDYINRETDSSIRATVVSVSQLFSRALFSIISPFLGWIADLWSFEAAFLASGIIFGGVAIFSFVALCAEMKKERPALVGE